MMNDFFECHYNNLETTNILTLGGQFVGALEIPTFKNKLIMINFFPFSLCFPLVWLKRPSLYLYYYKQINNCKVGLNYLK